MIRIELSISDIDYNRLASKFLPKDWNNPVVKSVIKYIPAKNYITTSLVSNNSRKIIEWLNESMKKEGLSIKIRDLSTKNI